MFWSTIRLAVTVGVAVICSGVAAQADDAVRLKILAAQSGYTFEWMPSEAGVTLLRPGVRIVLHAGQVFYEINNATPIADRAPRFDGHDFIISAQLAQTLRQIATHYPARDVDTGSAPVEPHDRAQAAVPSDAVTLDAHQIPGRETLVLTGNGPAGATILLTLSGELSTDLPVVVLSRTSVTTATDGTFSAEVHYGQDTHPRTILIARASTLAGASSAYARVTIGVPSPHIKTSGLDEWPKK